MGAEPPLVMAEVKFTLCPEQVVVTLELIVIVGVTEALTVTVTELEVAGLPVTPERLDVMTHVIASEPAGKVVVV